MEDTDFVLIARTTENTTFQGEPREKKLFLDKWSSTKHFSS